MLFKVFLQYSSVYRPVLSNLKLQDLTTLATKSVYVIYISSPNSVIGDLFLLDFKFVKLYFFPLLWPFFFLAIFKINISTFFI